MDDIDDDADLMTVDRSGLIRFYENERETGFREVGKPVQVNGTGKLKIRDMNNDGQMDVVVDVAPDVEEIVKVGAIFGVQPAPIAGKRAVRFAMFDHLGTAKLMVNNRGRVVWPQRDGQPNETLPFGKDLDFDRTNPDPVEASYKLTFTNKEIDHDLDLHYFGARYYNAGNTQFLSPDPVPKFS